MTKAPTGGASICFVLQTVESVLTIQFEEMVLSERFELPASWFVGMRRFCVFTFETNIHTKNSCFMSIFFCYY